MQVLSQKEIDSLLTDVGSGELNREQIEQDDKNKIREYDFKRPIKLSKEYVNTLYMIFEAFAKTSSNIMSTMVRTNVNMALEAIEQVSFDEFIRSIPNPTIVGIFHSEPLNGSQIIEVNSEFGVQVLELLCGGSSHKEVYGGKKEKFTDIELGILEDLILNLLKGFKSAWGDIIDMEPELDSLETNAQVIQTTSPNEPVVLVTFEVEIFERKSFINICIPYVSFENVIDKLSIRSWFDVGKSYDNSEYRKQIEDRLVNTEVTVTVELGRSNLTVEDFIHLDEGDIIQLEMRTDMPMRLYIEDKLHYLVQPGIHKNKLAVQVLQYVEEDVEI